MTIEASDHREKLLEHMADQEHNPFYTPEELREAIGIDSNNMGDVMYFNQLLGVMGNQRDITVGGSVAPDSYVLPYRAREHARQHEGQIL